MWTGLETGGIPVGGGSQSHSWKIAASWKNFIWKDKAWNNSSAGRSPVGINFTCSVFCPKIGVTVCNEKSENVFEMRTLEKGNQSAEYLGIDSILANMDTFKSHRKNTHNWVPFGAFVFCKIWPEFENVGDSISLPTSVTILSPVS